MPRLVLERLSRRLHSSQDPPGQFAIRPDETPGRRHCPGCVRQLRRCGLVDRRRISGHLRHGPVLAICVLPRAHPFLGHHPNVTQVRRHGRGHAVLDRRLTDRRAIGRPRQLVASSNSVPNRYPVEIAISPDRPLVLCRVRLRPAAHPLDSDRSGSHQCNIRVEFCPVVVHRE
jgi:hypothetical protein